MLYVRILGTGKYLPKTLITADQLDKKVGFAIGTTLRVSGVETRHFIEDETASMMGAVAAKEALANANLTIQDIDCIICSSGTHEQSDASNSCFNFRAIWSACTRDSSL
jgi:3-oxoacyl-[acyl-carrier-protein] synthase-3